MIKLHVIPTGTFKLDGGAMFGIVPQSLWAKLNPPDEQNLCTWAMRTLLLETPTQKILIDTGIGNKQDAKFRSHFHPSEHLLMESLAQQNIDKQAITDVILTHLHFDHVGGACELNEKNDIVASFPEATYWSNEKQWNWAMQPNMKEKASFLQENFVPIRQANRLNFIDVTQNVAFNEHINLHFTYGHTEAMMMPMLKVNGKTIVFCADTLAASYFIPMPYVMSYDIRPLRTLEEKAWLLSEAAEKNWILFFEHDPVFEAATIKKDEKGRLVVDKAGKLADFLG